MPQPFHFRAQISALAAIVCASVASPAAAAEPSTRLVRCQSGSCLLIEGHRADPATAVSINGHAVTVDGRRHWRVSVPVETVREWSAPFARTIAVALSDAETQGSTEAQADLPIGLLGDSTLLASLVVRAR